MDYCWNCGTEIEAGCMKYAPDEYGRPFYPVCPDCFKAALAMQAYFHVFKED